MELSESLHREVRQLGELADSLIEQERYENAIAKFEEAKDLLPEPKTQWDAFSWLMAGIGDAYFLSQQWEKAKEHFLESAQDVESLSNPFIQIRLGQCFFELDDRPKALDHLMRAYMMEGLDIFEEEPKHYYEFLQANIKEKGSK